ncbi:hypothetical protein AMAG_19552 [Allomyces macrogynus ATCC 38327]|uniref:Uncharacterized protein n=1 Tax=Allomyces macrogynus (strain ATCC 38327) TaxID=578462 RepID=A0A0L0SWT7_ALLM3|nr:hypothetical protein AMAG_19552 [Allomyces macrogynus ATCC 38327]|eukprot:KNE66946.1 hypothetical protein AMAG_19552 [Allomyces macrogynus ATCC 38327]
MVALNKLVVAVGKNTAGQVSRDTLLARSILPNVFYHRLAFLYMAEMLYLQFMFALAKAVAKDASLVKNVPLPPLDVAMF